MFTRFYFNTRRLLLVLVCSVFLVSCERLLTPDFNTDITELRGGAYTLDPNHATLLWKLNHLGFSTFIGRFNDFDASLDFDPENIEFAEELRGDSWFNVEEFPQAAFKTTAFVESIDEDTFVFQGDLTLLGVTLPMNLEINFHGGGRNFLTRSYTLGFSASGEFLRSDFGLDRFTSFGVGDNIELEIHVEFMAVPE